MSLGILVRHCRLGFLLFLCPVTSRRTPGLPTRGLSWSAPARLQRNRPATPFPPSRAGVVPTSTARATTGKASAGCRTCGQGVGAAAGAILAGFLFDLTGGYNFGFILCSIFTFCGALLFWVIPQIRYAKV